MDTRTFKTSLYQELAQVTKALSNPSRLEILDLLAQGTFPVEYIAEQTNLPIANTSQHLQVLKKSGLVKTEKRGKYKYYQLAGESVLDTWCALRKLGFEQNSQIKSLLEDFRNHRDSLDMIDSDELSDRIKNEDVFVIDVRPEEEYNLGHIINAVSCPQKTLNDRLDELPEGREIVAYCRGPLCLRADEAVHILRREGFQAKRLKNGYMDWLAAKKPVSQQ
ncbi:MAG: metalloregulator ArsR/SmtB family transcription factor [Bacteroidetes bacterium]|jgi:rhodanese-related sulfurtransferase/predicted transcriptional regulator|nr:metalloregulator ArsR/SmtB family transcription factor [Bacteroidota bacterium]